VILGIDPPKSYVELLTEVQPRPISSEEEADAIQAVIDTFIDKPDELTDDEQDFLSLLGDLIYAWEQGRYGLPSVPPLQMLRTIMADNGVRQVDLVGSVFPTRSVASAVLSGKRKLSYDTVGRLAKYFRVSPALFYPVV
jgi:HTH-type transcriptional regulator/antitoxin HigA